MRISKTAPLFLLICTLWRGASAEPEAIAARVNGDVLFFSQLDSETAPEIRPLRDRLKGRDLRDAVVALRKRHLQRMIDRTLLLQELARRGIRFGAKAKDEEIDAAIKDRFHSDREEWLKKLKLDAVIENYYFK